MCRVALQICRHSNAICCESFICLTHGDPRYVIMHYNTTQCSKSYVCWFVAYWTSNFQTYTSSLHACSWLYAAYFFKESIDRSLNSDKLNIRLSLSSVDLYASHFTHKLVVVKGLMGYGGHLKLTNVLLNVLYILQCP